MALEDGIREPYRVSGISRTASGYVYAGLRVRRKAARREGIPQEPEAEHESRHQDSAESSDGKKHINIKA